MVRTADNSLRVAGGKAPRKGGNARQESSSSRSPPSGSGDRSGGLNSVCPRETPAWQKPITTFFTVVDKPIGFKGEVQDKSDVNMAEIDQPQCSHTSKHSLDAMDEEFHEITIGASENNKENETNGGNMLSNSANSEMKEFTGNLKKKLNSREDSDEEMAAPPKRIKLDTNIYKQLSELESS